MIAVWWHPPASVKSTVWGCVGLEWWEKKQWRRLWPTARHTRQPFDLLPPLLSLSLWVSLSLSGSAASPVDRNERDRRVHPHPRASFSASWRSLAQVLPFFFLFFFFFLMSFFTSFDSFSVPSLARSSSPFPPRIFRDCSLFLVQCFNFVLFCFLILIIVSFLVRAVYSEKGVLRRLSPKQWWLQPEIASEFLRRKNIFFFCFSRFYFICFGLWCWVFSPHRPYNYMTFAVDLLILSLCGNSIVSSARMQ